MKIVYLTDQTFLHGGIEKVLATKANFLAEQYHHQVTVVTTEQKGHQPCYTFSEKVNLRDIAINYYRDKSYFHPLNLIKAIKHFFKIKKLIKQLQPDVIVVSNYSFDFYFLPYILSKIPKIKEFHSSRYLEANRETSKNLKEKVMAFLSRNAERKYHQLVVLNPAEKEFYNSEKITVIPNPVPMSNLNVKIQNKKIMAAGRISPVKNFGELIDIFNELKYDLKDWELHFYGEDYLDTQKNLEQKIAEYQLEHQVKFAGTTNDMLKTMQEYSIYAMTSETECFPMVLLEALSVGLPIISYNCPTGPQFIIKSNEDGFLVQDQQEFIKQLKKLIGSRELRENFSKNGKENAKRFSEKKVMKLWNNLFVDLCNV